MNYLRIGEKLWFEFQNGNGDIKNEQAFIGYIIHAIKKDFVQ